MTITKLSETSSDQVRTLLENCGVKSIKERAGRFDIECPSCQKTEAFIEYKHDKRWIKCNRDNNCGYNQSLWDLIAEKQGILDKLIFEQKMAGGKKAPDLLEEAIELIAIKYNIK